MFNNGLKKIVADLAEQVQQLAANVDGHFGQHGLKSSNHSEGHGFSLATTTIPYYHLIVDCLNMLGVAVMVFSLLGIVPLLILTIFPGMFQHAEAHKNHGKILLARMQLSRGLLLGMDIMVVSDVIETLCGQVDLVKLLVIVAVRSWLGYERTKEMQHMEHEFEEWEEKAKLGLRAHLGGNVDSSTIDEKIDEVFRKFDLDGNGKIDVDELRTALGMVGCQVNANDAKKMMKGAAAIGNEEFGLLVRDIMLGHQGQGKAQD